jgi:hypothetical protein
MARRSAGILLTMGCALAQAGATTGPPWGEREQLAFIREHWQTPLAPQGQPPRAFGPLEASLSPEACGACHPVQFADWKESLHSASMGPGVAGQLVELSRSDPDQAAVCYGCHAPLAEQRPGQAGYDPALAARGIVCASCHVRGWQRFGPPRRDGSLHSAAPRASLPHNGVTRTPAYLRSEFCRDCHQFGPDGLQLSGKLLQNTFEEWTSGPAAAAGLQCQDCHMPDRRHQWRGIHDHDMVKDALAFSVARIGSAIELAITNARAGHMVPTYVTPRLVISGETLDAAGDVVTGSRRESVIGRAVTLDLSRELQDTRLAPGQSARFRYERGGPGGVRLRLRVVVEPDHFYTRFFQALLESGAGAGEAQIRQALEAARRSAFTVYEHHEPLTDPGRGDR